MRQDAIKLANRTKAVEMYMDSLFRMSKYELREEIRVLYLQCCLLKDCENRVRIDAINNVIEDIEND